MISSYEQWLIYEIGKIDNFSYDNIKLLDSYPLCISRKVLKTLIENACLGQNLAPIELGRKKINEIDKVWLKNNLLEVASSCIDFSDEWEYRRLVELVDLVIPELKQKVLEIGETSDNEEVREAVEDYRDNSI